MQVFIVVTHHGWGESTSVDGVFQHKEHADAELERQRSYGLYGEVEEWTVATEATMQPLSDPS